MCLSKGMPALTLDSPGTPLCIELHISSHIDFSQKACICSLHLLLAFARSAQGSFCWVCNVEFLDFHLVTNGLFGHRVLEVVWSSGVIGQVQAFRLEAKSMQEEKKKFGFWWRQKSENAYDTGWNAYNIDQDQQWIRSHWRDTSYKLVRRFTRNQASIHCIQYKWLIKNGFRLLK